MCNAIRKHALLFFLPILYHTVLYALHRSSVDEVIGLLSAPAADGSFEDEGMGSQDCDPAQFDSWRNSLTKVRRRGRRCCPYAAVAHGLRGSRTLDGVRRMVCPTA